MDTEHRRLDLGIIHAEELKSPTPIHSPLVIFNDDSQPFKADVNHFKDLLKIGPRDRRKELFILLTEEGSTGALSKGENSLEEFSVTEGVGCFLRLKNPKKGGKTRDFSKSLL